jgi:CheY-like chemotaxis protein
MIRPRVVLVVEDDQLLRAQLTNYVANDLGLPTATARSGAEALARLHVSRPGVVLIDLTMPGGDGFELARRLRRSPIARGAWIVGVTVGLDPRPAFDAGCDEVLVRPFDLAMVRRAVEAAASRKDLVYCAVPLSPRLRLGEECPRCGRRVDDPADHMRQAGRCAGGSGRERNETLSGRPRSRRS